MFDILVTLPAKYMLDGFLGAILYILVQKYGWNDKPEIFRRLCIGLISGYLVYTAGLPNSLTAFGLGYIGIDAIEAVINKYKPKQEK